MKKVLRLIIILLLILYFAYFLKTVDYNKPNTNMQYLEIESITGFLNKHPQLKYTTTLFWRKTEPINFIFLASSEKKLINTFLEAWFYHDDNLDLKNLKKLILAAYWGKFYETAPMTPMFWNWKAQLIWFQEQNSKIDFRHHIRIWNTKLTKNGFFIFVWSAVYDNGIKWKIVHQIDPYIDKEREYFFEKIKKTKYVVKYKKIQLVPPTTWKNIFFDDFYTDWKTYIIWIK